jgi:mevalonate kinase
MHGARALAVPLRVGQSLQVHATSENHVSWEATTPDGLWFNCLLRIPDLKVINTSDPKLGNRLSSILSEVAELMPSLLSEKVGANVRTHLEFNPQFGFGSSSTLVSNLSAWAGIDSYALLANTFGGSGYDIACAQAEQPIIYALTDNQPTVRKAGFYPSFANQVYFVYLGSKQKSSDAITEFSKSARFNQGDIDQVNHITEGLLNSDSLEDFETLIAEHEELLSQILQKPKVKDLYFADLDGCAKSLGAWGGDFVLLTTRRPRQEFVPWLKQKGFETTYGYSELVLS